MLLGWALFAGGASGTGATAPLGTAAVRRRGGASSSAGRAGAVALPRLDRAGARRRRPPRSASSPGSGLTRLVVDRGRPLLGRAREGDRPARLRRRRPRRRRSCPGGPLRSLALLLAAAARCRPRLGAARQGDPGPRPGRRGPRRAAEGIDRLLERARAPRRRGARPRPLARRLGARALRPPGGCAAPLRGHARDPADAVARRARSPGSPSSRSRSGSRERRVEAALLGAARRPARRSSSPAGRSRGPRSSRTAARAPIASPTARLLGVLIVVGAVVVLALVALVPVERLVVDAGGARSSAASSAPSALVAVVGVVGLVAQRRQPVHAGRPTRSAARARS